MVDSASDPGARTAVVRPQLDPERLRWHRAQLVAGHGVASGRSAVSPYPAGTIALQRPHFAAAGLDLSDCYPGTLNLAFAGGRWHLQDPVLRLEQLRWTSLHPPETFSFWPCLLRWPGLAAPVAAWIYRPHPETKACHFQPEDRLEVLAPWQPAIAAAAATGADPALELGVEPRCCRLIQPARLRARLLEFLKFRVLAAQGEFFRSFEEPAGLEALRRWLAASGAAEALDLSDADLQRVLQAARDLYLS
jgi:hypothetical protein